MKEKQFWFLGFTAAFAMLAGFVFWGTWSPDFAPVMPDNAICHSPYWLDGMIRGWFGNGNLIPTDLLFLFGGPYVWQELKYVVALYLAALGLAYFLRGRGLPRLSCYGAGLLLAFSGYWMTLFSAGHYGWFQWMTYGVFAFGLVDRAVRRGKARHWLLLGATATWGCYNQPDLWLLFTAFTGVYFLHACWRERKFPWKGMLLAGVTAAAVGAAGFYSAIFFSLAGRDKQIDEGQTVAASVKDDAEKRWIFVTNWSLPPDETAEFFIPRLNGDTSCPMTQAIGRQHGHDVKPYTGALGRPKDAPSGNYRQHSLYVGFVTCLLALLGCAKGLRGVKGLRGSGGSDVAFFLAAAAVFWLFSLGRHCEPVYRIVYALPFGDYLRAPVKWHHLTEFCLAVLAGFGIAWLLEIARRHLPKGRLATVAVGCFIVLGAIDLARVDKLYCSPVDLREARRQNCSLQMTFLRKQDFANPQVAAMVKAKRIVALANVNPEVYLVGVLHPYGKKNTAPLPPMSPAAWLGLVSIIASLTVAAYSVFAVCRLEKKGKTQA